MEKRGVIEPGRTPPENEEKQASTDTLDNHVTKRAADAAESRCCGGRCRKSGEKDGSVSK